MKNKDEKVLVDPGAFSRKIKPRENVLLALIKPYLSMARVTARASRRRSRLDWGGLWNVPDSRGGFSIAGPAVGSSVAVMMIETLIARGAKRIIAVGCCGSIRDDIKIGDIIISTGAFSEEGVSQHYMPGKFPPRADEQLVEALKSTADGKGWDVKTGDVWTTDAPYRETCRKVKEYGEGGLVGVEMELSAIFTVSRFRGVKAGAVLAVSDELHTMEWKPGFLNPAFLKSSGRTIKLAIETLKNLK